MATTEKTELRVDETRGFFDWYLVDAVGFPGAVLYQWIKHSSKHGWRQGAWRTTMKDIAVLLGRKERATYDVVKRLRVSGLIDVKEVQEKKSPNGYALHFSVNEEREEEIRLQSEKKRVEGGRFEFLRRKGTTSKPEKGTTGRRLPTANGTTGRKPPTDMGTVGTRPPTGGRACQQKTADLTEIHTSRGTLLPETHTRAELRAGEGAAFATLTPHSTAPVATLPTPSVRGNNVEQNAEQHLRKSPPVSPPPVPPADASPSSGAPDALPPPSVEKAWSDAVEAVYGEEKYIPPRPTKREVENLVRFCTESKISPIDYVRWFVANWGSMRYGGSTKWMKLAKYPVFGSIVSLAPKALPSFMSALHHRSSWEEAVLPKAERERREEAERREREEEKRRKDEEKNRQEEAREALLEAEAAARHEEVARLLHLYGRMELIPDDHPLRDEIILKHKQTREPIAASQYECLPLSKVPKEQHAELQARWNLRLESYLYRKYANMTFGSAKEVPRDHPDRKELLEKLKGLKKGVRLEIFEGLGVQEIEPDD